MARHEPTPSPQPSPPTPAIDGETTHPSAIPHGMSRTECPADPDPCSHSHTSTSHKGQPTAPTPTPPRLGKNFYGNNT
eukprot:scaffold157314_cov30-Tisochrysis_lutea.AAC.2